MSRLYPDRRGVEEVLGKLVPVVAAPLLKGHVEQGAFIDEAGVAQADRVQRMDGDGRPVYSISAVARMLGVPVATLRTWEDRYALIVPQRNRNGHRLYSRDQIGQIRFIRTRMAEGASAADAHRLLAERLEIGTPVSAGNLSRPRLLILLAERDPYAAEFQEYFLKTEGFEVEVTLSLPEAARSQEEMSPALAVVELLISGGAGLDLCRSFKARGSMPVIAVSVLECRDQAFDAGADAFLMKPLDPLQLVSAVRDLLGSSAMLGAGGGPRP